MTDFSLIQPLTGAFPEREAGLREITRYHLYTTMYYRTNLWDHAQHVLWLVDEIAPITKETFGDRINIDRARVLALVHDDAELIIGDEQAGNKSKMPAHELKAIEMGEHEAVAALGSRYPVHLSGYAYGDLLQEAADRTSLEAQLVMLADKIDAFGEALHEVYAGNICFETNVINQYGKIPVPTRYYIDYLNAFTASYPAMAPLFEHTHWMLQMPSELDFKEICQKYAPHTGDSLKAPKNYPHYDEWLRVVVANSSPEQLESLLKPLEMPQAVVA